MYSKLKKILKKKKNYKLPVLSTQIGQRGILCSNTSGLIFSADTLCPHCVQDAVAKDPKHFPNININYLILIKKFMKFSP